MKEAIEKGRADPTYYQSMNQHCHAECNNTERSVSKIRAEIKSAAEAEAIFAENMAKRVKRS